MSKHDIDLKELFADHPELLDIIKNSPDKTSGAQTSANGSENLPSLDEIQKSTQPSDAKVPEAPKLDFPSPDSLFTSPEELFQMNTASTPEPETKPVPEVTPEPVIKSEPDSIPQFNPISETLPRFESDPLMNFPK
ncbi:MAG: hypothetical protein LBI03_05015, partial [Clostridiales bacterium]|nr:hypothetical protein [Clostridiales bacterium]